MRIIVFAFLLGWTFASPQPSYPGTRGSRGYAGGISAQGGGYGGPITCGAGEVNDGTGRCVPADVSRNVFVFTAPDFPIPPGPPPTTPRPKLEYNVVFVRTPEGVPGPDPIIVPPPRQRTIIYVLTKTGTAAQRVIEVPGDPATPPEVVYVNYNEDDEDIDLSGISLQEVLSRGGQQGQLISGGAGRGATGGAIGTGGYQYGGGR